MKIVDEAKESRARYWAAVYSMRQEYMRDHQGVFDLTIRPRIDYWANEKYGFQMGIDCEGNYTAAYTVTDPKKFMLFQIKYWK